MEKGFGTWHDQKISEGCEGWKKCTKMHCDHRDAHKDLQHRDPIGPPLECMKSHVVFKAKKMNAYAYDHSM